MLLIVGWHAPANSLFVGDTWYNLAAGRLIADHGLPHHDTWTVLGGGERWIDQQWLAQLAIYGVYRAAGYFALMLLGGLLVAGGVLGIVLLLRKRELENADERYWPFLGLIVVLFATSSLQLRAEAFAWPLLALMLWLLHWGAGSPKRLALGIPLLILWGNIHGSALLGVVLLGSAALGTTRDPRRRVAALAIALLAPLTILVNPWGTGILHYYANTVGNPAFQAIGEWSPTTVAEPSGILFFLFAGFALVSLGSVRPRLHALDWIVVSVLFYEALHSQRMVPWFVIVVCWLLAGLREGEIGKQMSWRPIWRAVAGAAALLAVVAAIGAAGKDDDFYFGPAREGLLEAMRNVAPATPGSQRVFASDTVADYLLFRDPSLAGRLVYDDRQELLSSDDIKRLASWLSTIECEGDCNPFDAGLVALDDTRDLDLVDALRASPRWELVAKRHKWVLFRFRGAVRS
jgi:hypothetical protein